MAATIVTLQSLTSAASGQTTTMSGTPVDLGGFGTLTVWVQRAAPADDGSASYLMLQTSNSVNGTFVDLSPPIDLTGAGVVIRDYAGAMRFVRWRAVVGGSTTAQFSIDILAREH